MCICRPDPTRLPFDKATYDIVDILHLCPGTGTIVGGKILSPSLVAWVVVEVITAGFEQLLCPDLGACFEIVAPLERDVLLAIFFVPVLLERMRSIDKNVSQKNDALRDTMS